MVAINFLVILVSLVCSCLGALYDNSTLLRFAVANKDQFEKIRNIAGLNVWNDAAIANGSILAHIHQAQKQSSLRQLDDLNIVYEIISENLQEIFDKESADLKKRPRAPGGALTFETYNQLRDIYDYIDSLPRRYPTKAKSISIGRTYEGREIKGFIIRKNIGQSQPIVFFECGIHAREWIAPAVCLWIANELLSKSNPLLDKYEFHIIPVVNPDGYVYTWTNDRLWRKNRAPSGNGCFGTDLNRNFDIDFCRVGCSRNPCDPQVFCGNGPFSESETRAVRDYFLSIKGSTKIYFDFHSFAQVWMYPYAYTKNPAPNQAQLDMLSRVGVQALTAVFGTQYRIGSIANLISPTSSSSLDWVYVNLPSRLGFAIELRDTGRYGFRLPKEQIRNTAIETWAGVTAVLNSI